MAGRTLHGPQANSPLTKCGHRAVATNKPPIVPYRGVARPGICFAMELAVDAMARELGREPYDLRMQNPFPATPCPTRRLPAVSSIAAIIRRRYAAPEI